MAVIDYKTNIGLNQIKKLNYRNLIVLQKLYIDLAIEDIFKKDKLESGLENLTFVKSINEELRKRTLLNFNNKK